MLGVHPAEGYDIPGVRSLKQLKQTALFVPDEYGGLVEVDNRTAYALTKRLNQEESIIAGPSSAIALEGAFRLIPDEEGVIAVVIFPDNAFKYVSSIQKHLPELFASAKKAPSLPSNLDPILDFARSSPTSSTSSTRSASCRSRGPRSSTSAAATNSPAATCPAP